MNPPRPLLGVPRFPVVPPPPPGAGLSTRISGIPGNPAKSRPVPGRAAIIPPQRGSAALPGTGASGGCGWPGTASRRVSRGNRERGRAWGGLRGGRGWLWTGAAATLSPGNGVRGGGTGGMPPVTGSGRAGTGRSRRYRRGGTGRVPPPRPDTCALPGPRGRAGSARSPLAAPRVNQRRRRRFRVPIGRAGGAAPPPGVPGTRSGCGGRSASRGCAARLGAPPAAGAELREHDGHRERGRAGLEPRGGPAAPARAGREVGVAGAAAAAAPRLRPRTPLVLPTAPRPPQPRAQPRELLLGRRFHGHLPARPPARLPGQHRCGAGGAAHHVPPAGVHPGHGLLPGAGAGAGDAGAAGAGRASRGVAGAAAQRLHPGRAARRPGGHGGHGAGGRRRSRGAPGRGAGAGAGAARGAGGAGAGAARGRRGRAARAAGAAAAQGRRGLRPLAGAAAQPPAPARRGLVPRAAGAHVPAGRRRGHGAGGGRGAAAAPVPGRAGGAGGRHLPLRHLPGDSAPGAGGAPKSHPQGHPDPRRLRAGQRHPLRQGMKMRRAGIHTPGSENPMGFMCPRCILLSKVPKCLSRLCASVSPLNCPLSQGETPARLGSPVLAPGIPVPPCAPCSEVPKCLSALCLSFPICTMDRCCDPPPRTLGGGECPPHNHKCPYGLPRIWGCWMKQIKD
nr:zinc transporter ZIP1 isoform X1 [Taeniopygia guttata]